jgi:hypothetical protein
VRRAGDSRGTAPAAAPPGTAAPGPCIHGALTQATASSQPSRVSTHTAPAALQAEEAERARLRREREEAHRYTFIRVATIADMRAQVGSDVFFDLVDVSKVGQQ